MRRIIRILMWVGFSMSVGSCAVFHAESHCVLLSPEVSYCLQSNALVSNFSVLQQMEVQRKDSQDLLLNSVEKDDQGLSMAVLTPLGQSLIQVSDTRLGIQASGGHPSLNPALPLALLQLAHWPAAQVEQGLIGNYEWDVRGASRRLMSSGVLLMWIEQTGKPWAEGSEMHVELPMYGVTVNIKNLQNDVIQ